jgi:predicted DNA-binding transcriptional regulator YafY
MTYRNIACDVQTLRVDAYALVSKSDRWYLVGRKPNRDYRTYRLERIQRLDVRDDHFQRDTDFDLLEYWQASRDGFHQQMRNEFPPYTATLHVDPAMIWYFARLLDGRFRQLGEPDKDGWLRVEVQFTTLEEARAHVRGLGTQVTVITPDELRTAVTAEAKAILNHYSDAACNL